MCVCVEEARAWKAPHKHTQYVNVKNRVSVTTAGEISTRAAEDSMRLVLVPEDQDKAELCERGQDVCSGALLLHLLTDLDGAMSGLANRSETIRKQQR